MILHSLDIEFTDNRLSLENFLRFIATGIAEFGETPFLVIYRKVFVKSRGIERYPLVRVGINPTNHYEVYLNDSTVSFIDDVTLLFIQALCSIKVWKDDGMHTK